MLAMSNLNFTAGGAEVLANIFSYVPTNDRHDFRCIALSLPPPLL